MWAVSTYVLGQILRRRKRYPLVLMLEPLLRCNLACAGCGKIQYPGHILKREMSVEDALAAADECGAPIVSIPGGEPLMHPGIGEIVAGLVKRKKYVYLCTNALLLKQRIEEGVLTPTKYLTCSVHLDGDEEAHDFAVCREGVYPVAEEAIRFAIGRGFRVTCNTTLFDHVDTERMRRFFDRVMEIGVEGITISPGYSYDKAPDQEQFLSRSRTYNLFRALLKGAKKTWRFNQSPLFLEFLMGKRHFECTPWGNPCYTLFGWQKPCYLLQEGYAESFDDLLAETDWDQYGRASGNPKCQQCMVHCGYEPTAVHHTFSSLRGFWDTVKATIRGIDSNQGPNVTLPPVLSHTETGKDGATPGTRAFALWDALDFRGDVTLTLTDKTTRTGYLSNVTPHTIELFEAGGKRPGSIRRDTILSVERTGRDHADGQSWEAWVKKYDTAKAEREEKQAQLKPLPLVKA
jgi:hopanoid biosynthesis associated radical SAM protein HpnH